jgi:hypothetical protein
MAPSGSSCSGDGDRRAAATVERLVRELDDVPLADLPERLTSSQAMRAYLAHNDQRRRAD